MKRHQALDKEDRAAWRNLQLTKIEADAEKEKRAEKIQMAQIEAAREQAKIEADKELTLKELELKAQQDQVNTSLAATPPRHNKDVKSSELPSFIDEKDELDSYLVRFERYMYAENASWE